MASASRNVAWGIAVLAVVAAVVFTVRSARTTHALEEKLAAAEAARDAAGAKVAPPREEAVPAPPIVPASPAPPADAEEVAPAPVPAAEDAPKEDEEKQRAQRQRIVDAQMTLMMNIAYGPLFDELGLDAGQRERALELIVGAKRGVQQAAEAALRAKDTTAAEMKAREDAAEASLREDLEGLLSPAELAAWDEYQDYADQIMYAQLLDGQLTMLSPGLSPEGREVVKEVFAEELAVHLEAFGESDAIYTLDAFNQAQLDALLAGLDRLAGTLAADQFGHAQGFVKQVQAVFAAMAEP